jgi:transposase
MGQQLPDWIEGQTKALAYFGGVPKAIVCDNLKAAVAKALWFEPTLNQTFAAMAEPYDTTIFPTRSRKPRQRQGRGCGFDRRTLDLGAAAPSALLRPGRSQCRDRCSA